MPGDNENHRNISHHGIKAAQGFAARVSCVAGHEMPDGILSMTPLGAGRSSPYAPASARPPRGEPREMRPPHTPSPHRYAPETERASVVITPRFEK
jgi:hypothetical protein